MADAKDIITGALRRLGVIASDQPVDPNDQANVLIALNDMIFEWRGKGVDITPTALEPETAFPMAEDYHAGTKALLAVRVAPDFEEPINAQLKEDSIEGWAVIQAGFIEAPTADIDSGLKIMPSSQRSRFR